MKRLIFIAFVLFCCTSCMGPKSCEAYTQCDELYINDYNCVRPQRNTYSPSYNTYRDYYPNTQTVYYYYPVIVQPTQPIPQVEQRPTRNGNRPGSTTRNSRN